MESHHKTNKLQQQKKIPLDCPHTMQYSHCQRIPKTKIFLNLSEQPLTFKNTTHTHIKSTHTLPQSTGRSPCVTLPHIMLTVNSSNEDSAVRF